MVHKTAQTPTSSEDPFDQLLGHFGRWQLLLVATICIVKTSTVQLAIIFLTPSSTFWCTSVPNNTSFSGANNTCYDDCEMYNHDVSPMENTIVSEWDLICDRKWLASFTQTILQLGVLCGQIIFGFLSDRYGRKNTFLVCTSFVIAFGFGVPYSPNYTAFTIIKFFLGLATGGIMVISFVIVMESIGSKYRAIVGCVYQIPISLGQMSIPVIAYYFRHWDDYSLVLAIPHLTYLVYFFTLSESPRWLVSNGRLQEAAAILKKAAMVNNLPITNINESLQKFATDVSTPSSDQKVNYLDLLTPSLRWQSICYGYIWFTGGLVYYGLNQYIGQTSSDPFISVAVAGAILIPSGILSIWVTNNFGRKITIITFCAMQAICTICLGCAPDIFWLKLSFGSLGVSCAFIVGSTLYLYTSEMYPTVVRNMAMGAGTAILRAGSMVAPFVSNSTVTWLPTLVFSVAALLGGAVCLCLPETRGKALVDRLVEIKDKN